MVTGRMTGSRALVGRYELNAHTTRVVLFLANSMVQVRSDGNVATLTVASGRTSSSTVEVFFIFSWSNGKQYDGNWFKGKRHGIDFSINEEGERTKA